MVESFFFSCFLYILFWLIFIFSLMTWYLLLLQARSTPAKGNRPKRHLSQQFRQKQFVHEIARCFRQRIFAWLNPRPDVISDRKSCIEVTLIHPVHQVLPMLGDPFMIMAVLSFYECVLLNTITQLLHSEKLKKGKLHAFNIPT